MRGEVTCQSILGFRVNEADVFRTSLKLNQWDVAGGGGQYHLPLLSLFSCFISSNCLPSNLPHSTHVWFRELETRNSQMLNIPLFRTATGQKTFYYRTVNIWNNLNNDIKVCIDVNSFRSKLRGVLLDKFKREE